MAIDEQLLNRNQAVDEEADNAESNASSSDYQNEDSQEDAANRAGNLRAAVRAQKSGLPPGSTGNLRMDKKNAQRKQGVGGKMNEAVKAALSSARKSLSSLLKSSWENLITSFGATLLWIDAHVFLNQIFGKELFCNLGEEWLPDKPGAKFIKRGGSDQSLTVERSVESVGLVEKMGCGLLNLIALLLIIGVLTQISLIYRVIEHPIQAAAGLIGMSDDLWKLLYEVATSISK